MTDPESRRAARTATIVAVPVTILVGVLAFWLLGGLAPAGSHDSASPRPTGTVSAPSHKLDARTAAVCRGFIAQLPGTVRGHHRRPVSSGAEQNAAFGQPPLLVSCGATAPSVPPTATVYGLSGVCFYAAKQPHRTVWTTIDRTVPVAVAVPNSYDSPGQWVAEFSDSISGTIHSSGRAPSGCG